VEQVSSTFWSKVV